MVATNLRARAAGRPRDQEVEDRILQVTLRLLAEKGYARMSLDEVAEASGASKPTIYRRWASKADVATAALRTIVLKEPAIATGDTLADLTGILQNFRVSLTRPNGMSLIGTVLSEEAHTPELLILFRERLVGPRRAMLTKVLEAAASRGELRTEANLDAAVNAMVGAFYGRYLATSKIPPGFPAEVAKLVWLGLKKD